MTTSRVALEGIIGARTADVEDLGFMFGQTVSGAPVGAPVAAPVPQLGYPVSAADPAQPVGPGYQMQMPEPLQVAIRQGESGRSGDDALYGHSQEPGGRFAGVKPTEMTVAQWQDFQRPDGEYAQWVAAQNDGVIATPMGGWQVVGDTFDAAVRDLGFGPDTIMDADHQKMVADWVYKNQGPGAWEALKKTMPGRPQLPGEGGPAVSTRGEPFLPEVDDTPARSMLETFGALFRGEKPEEFDFASGLQALGVGLGQMSRGAPIDVTDVIERRDRMTAYRVEQYKEDRARAAAANYAAEAGDNDAARAIMEGGMDLGTFLDERQRGIVNARAAEEDRQRAIGQQVIFDTVIGKGGTVEEAQAAAYVPDTYFKMEELERIDDEIALKNAEDQALRGWALERYSGMADEGDVDAGSIVSAAQNPNIPMEQVFEFFELDQKQAQADISRRNAETAEAGAETSRRRLEFDIGKEDRESNAAVSAAGAAREAGLPEPLAAAIEGGTDVGDAIKLGEMIDERASNDRVRGALGAFARSSGMPETAAAAIEAGAKVSDIGDISEEQRKTLEREQDRIISAATAVAMEDSGGFNEAEVSAVNQGAAPGVVGDIAARRDTIVEQASEEAVRTSVAKAMESNGIDPAIVAAVGAGADVGDALKIEDAGSAVQAKAAREAALDTIAAGHLDEAFPQAQGAALLMAIDPALTMEKAFDLAKADKLPAEWSLYEADAMRRGVKPTYAEYKALGRAPGVTVNTGDQTGVFKKLNDTVGEAMGSWVTSGATTIKSQLKVLDKVSDLLASGKVKSNAVVGGLMKSENYALLAPFITNEETITAADMTNRVVGTTMKETLGAQFAMVEGQQLLSRVYNPQLSPEANADRVKQFAAELEAIATTRNAIWEYVQNSSDGSIRGYKGPLAGATNEEAATLLNDALDRADAASGDATSKPISEMTDEELRRELGEE